MTKRVSKKNLLILREMVEGSPRIHIAGILALQIINDLLICRKKIKELKNIIRLNRKTK